MFKVNYAVEIQVHSKIIKNEDRALDENDFINLLKRDGFQESQYTSNYLFDSKFDFNSILGPVNLLS